MGKLGFILVAVAASACASTGATPRPFPIPGGHAAESGLPSDSSPPPGAADLVTPSAFDSYALVGTALALRGTPYRNGGSDPAGFDCSGFTQYVFGQYGVALPRGVRDQYRQGRSIDSQDLEAGDLIFFSTTETDASHVAIVIGGDEFVHAPSSTGVVRVERLSAPYWSRRYLGARRVN